MRLAAALLAAAMLFLASLAAAAPAARAQTAGFVPRSPDVLVRPRSLNRPPPRHTRSAREVLARARRVPKIQETLRDHPGWRADAFLKGPDRWQVSYYSRARSGHPEKEIAQVLIDDRAGSVLEAWTGFQVAWTMARGYPGAFGRKACALYVWIPLCLLFAIPFVDLRRPFRWLHLDLLVLIGFSASLAFFSHGRIGVSVPLSYPPLLYLLARMLAIGLSRRRRASDDRPLHLLVPASWLAVALVFLLGFRVGLNVTNSNVIDVGYSGVIGADRLTHGQHLYGHFPRDNEHGDTYGPVAYYAYVPFEQALPWSGRWDDLPAAHAAAVAFDLVTVLLLFGLGRRIRGPTLGLALAYAWAAYPFTLFVSNSNSNDSLVALLVTAVLLLASRPLARGAAAAVAGLSKFAPLALAPLLALHRPSRRGVLAFGLAFAAFAAAALVPVLLGTGLHHFYDRTLGFQGDRGSPFSVWGFEGGLGVPQAAVKIAAVVLALAVALVPRRRDVVGLAALSAAVLIALQLGVTHWFYLYIVWFLPAVLVALLGRYADPARTTAAAA